MGTASALVRRRLFGMWRSGASLVLVCCADCIAQPQIVDIGLPPGGPDSFVAGLSNDGSVAAATCNSPQRALRWTSGGGLVVLPQSAGTSSANSFAVSGDGARLSGSQFVTAISGRVPAYWIGSSGPFVFSLPSGWTQGSLNATNDDGVYHVGSLSTSLSGPTAACRLATTGPHVVIQVPGFGSSVGAACSGDGQTIAGTASTPGNRAFVWNAGTLAILPLAPAAVEGRSLGISHDGSIVVGGSVLGANIHKAFKWTAAGGTVALDTADPSLETQATRVTPDGSVVFGNSVYTVATGGALVWIDGQPGIFLRDYLTAAGLDTTGWRLDSVTGVSLDGRTIAGSGQHNGQSHGFVIQNLPSVCAPVILTQPQPVTAAPGSDASFSVSASPSSVVYTWYLGGTPLSDGPTGTGSTISGSGAAMLTVSGVSAADAGVYSCVITNACGGAVSNPAGLTVGSGCGTIVEALDCGATCTGAGQECGLLFEVTRDTCGNFIVEYTTAVSHCSNVGMRFFIDGVLRVQTPPVGPGISTGPIDLGPLPSGPHTLGMEGVGEVGGCNTGFLGDWAGSLRMTYCVSAPLVVSQPQASSACPEGSVVFSVGVTGGGGPSFLWQVSDPAVAGTWSDIADGDALAASGRVAFTASGAATSAVTIVFGPGFTDDWVTGAADIRCVVTNACGSVTSDPAVLRWCYANCDCSNVPPVLNANDFQCFLNMFANGDAGANCDGSNLPPVLNANDFQCFLNAFAGGCG